MQRKTWKNYLFESLLIVFSVMLALFLNQVVESINTAKQRENAIDRITVELERNQAVLEYWIDIHNNIKNRTEQIIAGESDSLKTQLLEQPYFNLAILTGGQSIINSNLSSTAWESAKSTQIINEFDFDTVEMLTGVYALQDIIFNQTLQDILTTYFERETHNLDNLDVTLIQFQLKFSELVGQEKLLIDFYRQALTMLDEH